MVRIDISVCHVNIEAVCVRSKCEPNSHIIFLPWKIFVYELRCLFMIYVMALNFMALDLRRIEHRTTYVCEKLS